MQVLQSSIVPEIFVTTMAKKQQSKSHGVHSRLQWYQHLSSIDKDDDDDNYFADTFENATENDLASPSSSTSKSQKSIRCGLGETASQKGSKLTSSTNKATVTKLEKVWTFRVSA